MVAKICAQWCILLTVLWKIMLMKIKYGKSLRLGLCFSLTLLALAAVAGQPSSGHKPGESAKFPAPKIDGLWQTSVTPNAMPRAVFIFGEHFQPQGAAPVLVKIGGKPSLFSNVITDGMIIAMPPPQQQDKASVTVETRTGSPLKAVGRAISPAKLGAVTAGVTISGIWPHQGAMGTFVFVFGSGFTPNTTRVTVNQTPAPLTQVIDQGLLIAQVPAGAASGAISVQTDSRRAKSKTVFSSE
jgi:hypothetical protein